MEKTKKTRRTWFFLMGALTSILLLISFISLCVGVSGINWKDVVSLIAGKEVSSQAYVIICNLRLPRIIMAFAIGGSLSLSGVILQGILRNPLAEPYTLGISGGAALGVCVNIVFGVGQKLGNFSLPVFGFLGALSVIMLLYFLSIKKGVLSIQNLLLIGVMISFISSALIMLIMAISKTEDLQGIIFWTMGSLEETDWTVVKIALGGSVLGLIGSYFFSLDLNAFSLGEQEAAHLGIDVEKTKKALFMLSALLTGLSVSFVGIIGFVGLVVPHFMRRFIGGDHRILLIGSFLCGAIFLIFCDMLSRVLIAPLELPVGVITGIIGGTIFIYVLVKSRYNTQH